MKKEVQYEVMTLSGTRWVLHEHFAATQRELAIDCARRLAAANQPCKVVREIYYPDTNESEDSVIWTPEREKRSDAPAHDWGAPAPQKRKSDQQPSPASLSKAQVQKNSQMGGLVLSILTAVISAVAAAVIVMTFVNSVPSLGEGLGPHGDSVLMFMTFAVTFVGMAWSLASKWVRIRDRTPRPESDAVQMPFIPQPMAYRAPAYHPAPPLPEPATDPSSDPLQGEEPDTTTASPAETAVMDLTDSGGGGYDRVEWHRATMTRFLSALLRVLRQSTRTFDAYQIFGINLMLAGAMDKLAERYEISGDDRRSALRQIVAALGTQPDAARAFADRYEDYMMEPRYLPMMQAGRLAMENYLASEADSSLAELTTVLERWNKPQASAAASSRIITIMFTDMVGSTEIGQKRGEQVSFDLVRRHNAIVRAALIEQEGKEIKHTGDGIMASFASAANAVYAAIAIQSAVQRHNAMPGTSPLSLRIGLNAGEPIEEGDDMFGTTIQLAARVCAECGNGEIFCTNVVRELARTKSIDFVFQGQRPLKGFKEAVPLFSVPVRP